MRLGSVRRRRNRLRDQSPAADDRAWARATQLRLTIGPPRPATDTPGFLRGVAATHALKLSVEPPRMRSLAGSDHYSRTADETIDRLVAGATPSSPSGPERQIALQTPTARPAWTRVSQWAKRPEPDTFESPGPGDLPLPAQRRQVSVVDAPRAGGHHALAEPISELPVRRHLAPHPPVAADPDEDQVPAQGTGQVSGAAGKSDRPSPSEPEGPPGPALQPPSEVPAAPDPARTEVSLPTTPPQATFRPEPAASRPGLGAPRPGPARRRRLIEGPLLEPDAPEAGGSAVPAPQPRAAGTGEPSSEARPLPPPGDPAPAPQVFRRSPAGPVAVETATDPGAEALAFPSPALETGRVDESHRDDGPGPQTADRLSSPTPAPIPGRALPPPVVAPSGHRRSRPDRTGSDDIRRPPRTLPAQAPGPGEGRARVPSLPPKPPATADGEMAVPARLQEQFRAITGADVGNVVIQRGEAAAADAARLGAASFAQGEVVVLPAGAGPLSDNRARGLLAHELTHVIQQRRLRGEVPVESSPAGQNLEREAQSVERHIRDEHDAPRPTVAPSPPPETVRPPGGPALSAEDHQAILDAANRLVAEGRATSDGHGGLLFDFAGTNAAPPRGHTERSEPDLSAIQPIATSAGGPLGPAAAALLRPAPAATPAAVQRAEAPAAPIPTRSSVDGELDTPPAATTIHSTFSGSALPSLPPSPGRPAVNAWPPGPPAPQTPSPAPAQPSTDRSLVAESPVAAESQPSVESEPPTSGQPPAAAAPSQPPQIDLDDLAKRLYDKVRRQIKTELLVERERVGLIADLR